MRIAKIDIESFRGIPGHCSLDFRDKSGKACSAIIYGGNGCGKSSIIDAIEFNLQARLARKKEIENEKRPSTLSVFYEKYKTAHTTVEFDDASINNRDIDVEFDQLSNKDIINVKPTECHDSFCFSPIVLRRNDIIAYDYQKVDNKQLLLAEFIYDFEIKAKTTDDPEIARVEKERQEVKNKRNSLIDKLKAFLHIENEESDQIFNAGAENYVKSRFCLIGEIGFAQKSKKLKQSLHPKELEKAIELAKEIDKLQSIKKRKNREKRNLVKIDDVEGKKFESLKERYKEAAKHLSKAFKEISNVDFVSSIDFAVADVSVASFEIIVTLKNGRKVPPQRIFSEANYDLMLLLLYVSMIRVGAEKGQAKILILDDVLQSVDATIRTKFISYVLREFSDWQLFITCHDRAWLNQLRHLFNNPTKGGRHQFKEFDIVKWSFDGGPIINNAGKDERLKKALNTNDINIIASTAGPFLEMICEKLSGFLNCQISRNPDDKYTIGDLWKGVKSALLNIGLEKEVKDINDFMFIRNMVGCHYSSWAEETSDFEILSFANAVQSLYEKTFCGEEGCMSWISGKYYENKSCHCGKLHYRKILST